MKDYKAVWNNLSSTLADALFFVGYLGEDEEAIRSNGKHTADFLRSVLQIEPTDRVLEIGCGVARIGHELAPFCAEWHGSDISGNMIKFARARTDDIPNIFLHELPEPNLSIFNGGYFDCVYSTIVFMHLDKAEMFNYMRETYRVLAPGGRAYFDTYNIVAPEAWHDFMALIEAFPLGNRPEHISQFSSVPEMRKFMEAAGFDEIHLGDENPALVVALGKKREQEDYERPATALNPEVVERVAAWRQQEVADTASHKGVAEVRGAVLPYDDWLALRENVAVKDAYIAQMETVVADKNRHIAALERHISKQEKTLGALPVRVAVRLSKGRK
jgi:ubiquinone/menaquinone biosynthesis C-methylase UbiE